MYTTSREVRIPSWRLAAVYYATTAALLVYVVLGDFVGGHGYQAPCNLVSSVATKAKGQSLVDGLGARTVLDASDLVASTGDGFFAPTSLRSTPQAMGACAGSKGSEACKADADCTKGEMAWSGEQTGRCVDNPYGAPPRTCEVNGWCPAEPDGDEGTHAVRNAANFTVYVRINSRFECAGGETFRYTNALGDEPVAGVNLFRIGEVVAGLGDEDAGMDVALTFAFDCNLDRGNVQETCAPSISARRLDAVEGSELSEGYNVRTVVYGNSSDPWAERTLTKWYGVRVRVRTVGQGRRFSATTTFTHVGSAVAMLSIAAVVTDMLLLYWFRNHGAAFDEYAQRKVLEVPGADDLSSPRDDAGAPLLGSA